MGAERGAVLLAPGSGRTDGRFAVIWNDDGAVHPGCEAVCNDADTARAIRAAVNGEAAILRIVQRQRMRGWHFECGFDAEGWWALFYAPEDAGTDRYDHSAAGATLYDAVEAALEALRG